MSIHVCTKDDMHPYECAGDPPCIHCNRTKSEHHNPDTCAFCKYDELIEERDAADDEPPQKETT